MTSALLCDLFLPIVQSQAVEEHDIWQHAFSDIDANHNQIHIATHPNADNSCIATCQN